MGPSVQLSTCVLFWGFLSVSSQASAILSRNNVTLLALPERDSSAIW